nr:PepSY-associated TM helix domain-containing protein [Sphingomonas sp. Y57]
MKRTPQHKPWYRSRGWWLKQLHNWHWMSAAVSLIGMLLFAATGITLNHAATIAASPRVQNLSAQLPAPLVAQLTKPASDSAPLPSAVVAELDATLELHAGGKPGEWSDDEVYVALPRPGGDAWISIDRASGAVTAEITDRGWISYLNDLHKGRNAGGTWSWFIDIFAAACILFTLTGLFLLYMHSKPRPLTWPLVGLGLVVPLLIIVLCVH